MPAVYGLFASRYGQNGADRASFPPTEPATGEGRSCRNGWRGGSWQPDLHAERCQPAGDAVRVADRL